MLADPLVVRSQVTGIVLTVAATHRSTLEEEAPSRIYINAIHFITMPLLLATPMERPTTGTTVKRICRPPSLVTSNPYDEDDAFRIVARSLLLRSDLDQMSERDAISAVLVTSEDKQAFLESLESRSAPGSRDHEDLHDEESPLEDLTSQVQETFGETLKLMWRESITGYDFSSSCMDNYDDDTAALPATYLPPPKTPKNWQSSPIRSVLCDKIRPKSSGRQRQRFFPDSSEQSPLRSRRRLDITFDCRLDAKLEQKLSNCSIQSPINIAAA